MDWNYLCDSIAWPWRVYLNNVRSTCIKYKSLLLKRNVQFYTYLNNGYAIYWNGRHLCTYTHKKSSHVGRISKSTESRWKIHFVELERRKKQKRNYFHRHEHLLWSFSFQVHLIEKLRVWRIRRKKYIYIHNTSYNQQSNSFVNSLVYNFSTHTVVTLFWPQWI